MVDPCSLPSHLYPFRSSSTTSINPNVPSVPRPFLPRIDMQTTPRPISALLLLLALTLLGSGCSPQAKMTRHLQSADSHYPAGDYDKAEVEYLNALKLEPQNGHA